MVNRNKNIVAKPKITTIVVVTGSLGKI